MLEIIKNTLTDNAILGAIFSSVSIILLGFYLRKKEIINSTASKMITKVVLTLSLPALAFTSFMKDINGEQLREGLSILKQLNSIEKCKSIEVYIYGEKELSLKVLSYIEDPIKEYLYNSKLIIKQIKSVNANNFINYLLICQN